ncbi:hypothetical protein WA026_002079 [Henosepilachna vigintioctopunctata]|uniref:Transposase n=1 Tax=Henosepilachna vigintioctopunctata TaxID=420089 RepID=A0AAW1U057_9CUCU
MEEKVVNLVNRPMKFLRASCPFNGRLMAPNNPPCNAWWQYFGEGFKKGLFDQVHLCSLYVDCTSVSTPERKAVDSSRCKKNWHFVDSNLMNFAIGLRERSGKKLPLKVQGFI